jgi:enoyl-CoA hydratase
LTRIWSRCYDCRALLGTKLAGIMPYETLSLDAKDAVAVITLGRESQGNRVDRLLIAELRHALDRIVDTGAVRAVVLTGTGKAFSLGWDAELLGEVSAGAGAALEPGLLGTTFQFLADAPLPVIVAINGDAFSAGLEMALACDLRLAAGGARLALPDTGEGRIPMAGGTQRLARLAGRGLAVEMILTGRILDAVEALRTGIVSEIVEADELLPAAMRTASAIAARGPLAVRLAKEAVLRGFDMPLEQALRYETDLTVLLQTTADRAEGVRAFAEKRPPRFEGR